VAPKKNHRKKSHRKRDGGNASRPMKRLSFFLQQLDDQLTEDTGIFQFTDGFLNPKREILLDGTTAAFNLCVLLASILKCFCGGYYLVLSAQSHDRLSVLILFHCCSLPRYPVLLDTTIYNSPLLSYFNFVT